MQGDLLELETRLLGRLSRAGFEPVPVPPQWARAGRGKLALRAQRLQQDGNQVRLVRIASDRVFILNALGLPADPAGAPLFEAEMVFFRQNARVLYLDLAVLPSAAGLRECRDLPELPPPLRVDPENLSEYIDRRTTWQPLFARDAGPEIFQLFSRFLPKYLETWLKLCQISRKSHAQPSESQTAEQIAEPVGRQLAEFLEHHLTETPGRLFLSRTFGAEWAEDFLRGFMYHNPPLNP